MQETIAVVELTAYNPKSMTQIQWCNVGLIQARGDVLHRLILRTMMYSATVMELYNGYDGTKQLCFNSATEFSSTKSAGSTEFSFTASRIRGLLKAGDKFAVHSATPRNPVCE